MINRGYQYNIFFRMSQNKEHTVTQGVEITKLSRINDLTYTPPVILCDARYPVIDNPEAEFMH